MQNVAQEMERQLVTLVIEYCDYHLVTNIGYCDYFSLVPISNALPALPAVLHAL